MTCNCNTVNPTCEPCAICTPPGVVGLTTCQPPDPCPDGSLDINCIIYNGQNFPCASVQNGDTLISVLLEILSKIFPPSYCCGLQGTINYSTCGLAGTIAYYTTTTTTSTSTTTTTTLIPSPCNFYQFTNTSQTGSSVVSYVPCNCNYRITQEINKQPVTLCVNNSFSVIVVSGSVTVDIQGPCTLPPCPTTTSTTSTTTSTTSSTTSTTSTTTTTTLCPCQNYTFNGGPSGVTSFNIVNCPGSVVQTLNLSNGQSAVRCIDNTYPIIVGGAANGTYIAGDCGCGTTTTTTSTTSTTSTTTTTTVEPSQLCFVINIPETTTTTSTTSTTSSTTSTTSTTTTTTILPEESEWLVRNADCGGGTINDTLINGVSMVSLIGNDFPLTSTQVGFKLDPLGINYGGLNTIQCNVTTNLPGVGNCAVMYIIINGVTTPANTLYFSSNPFPQITGVVINSGDTVEVRISCFGGPCP